MILSKQAQDYVNLMRINLDEKDLEKFMVRNLIIGGGDIMNYFNNNKQKYDIK